MSPPEKARRDAARDQAFYRATFELIDDVAWLWRCKVCGGTLHDWDEATKQHLESTVPVQSKSGGTREPTVPAVVGISVLLEVLIASAFLALGNVLGALVALLFSLVIVPLGIFALMVYKVADAATS